MVVCSCVCRVSPLRVGAASPARPQRLRPLWAVARLWSQGAAQDLYSELAKYLL